jgi:hypothetical protein
MVWPPKQIGNNKQAIITYAQVVDQVNRIEQDARMDIDQEELIQ